MMNRPPVAYVCSEDLNASIEQLGRDRYHLFVNGQWLTAYGEPGELLRACRELGHQGQAVTVVAAGEIVLYSARSTAREPPLASPLRQKLSEHLDQPPRER
jgi:hypothetical protein